MSTVALYMPNPERLAWWVKHLSSLLPDHRVLAHPDVTEPDDVRYVVAWKPPAGWIAKFPNLVATVSVGAGIDHIAVDPDYPAHVPIIKTKGEDLTQRMREYVALHVLRHHRELPRIERMRETQIWDQPMTPTAFERRVGIMGMGDLGRASAATLRDLGFNVAGWSRSGGTIDGVAGFAQTDFDAFLARSDILVCLLPLTPDTRGILNADTLARLPDGAMIINAARGDHLIEGDLIPAMDSGKVAAATLDVFAVEPLPKDHPFWKDSRITITPHTASLVDPVSGGKIIARNILAHEAGETIGDVTEVWRGY